MTNRSATIRGLSSGRARTDARSGKYQQCERHDREAAPLQQRSDPDEGYAPPAEGGFVFIRAESDQCSERREYDRQCDHQRDKPGGHTQLHDHHPVQRAGNEDQRHADRDLEQGQAQDATERQFLGRNVGERQHGRAQAHPELLHAVGNTEIHRDISTACEK